ncbi:MAG: amino acid adenylation domain-containing protein [Oscillospiraceae bacterium]|nr:amino acid adenylation domain-containing protein [Oscillospiraceae bacterium]
MEYYALTHAQRRIYELERYADGAAGIAASILFAGRLEEAAVQRALNRIIETNDALRLRMTPEQRQYVLPFAQSSFRVRTFLTQEQLHAWAAQVALEPMQSVAQGNAPYDFTIVTAAGCYGLFVRFHHIVADAWSAARFASLLHRYLHDPTPVECPSYLEYIRKQEDYWKSARCLRDKDFWVSEFAEKAPSCFLAGQPQSAAAAARWDTFLPPAQAQPLRAFASAHGLSLFSLLLTAMAVYLYRLRGQSSPCVGTTTLGRADAAAKRTMGMFAGTMPLPLRLDPAADFLTNALATKATLFAAVRHEGYGYTDVLSALKDRDGFDGRLYDVLVNYQNAAVEGMGDDFLGTHWYFCGAQPETLQLQANDRDNTGGLFLSYDYQLAVLGQEDVRRLHARLMALLGDAIACPGKPVAQITMLCEEDKRLWEALNRSEHPLALRPVHRFLEEQAAAHPQREAVLCGEDRLNYRQLDDWANRIAGWLRGRGVAPGGVVALRMERCTELMPLLLGILKAGCAYLPVLPAWPVARAAFVLKDAGAALLVCGTGCEIAQGCCPAVGVAALHGLPPCDVASADDPALPAYVMYTSGSTGNPKGVRVGQAGLCNRLLWMEDAYPLAQGERLIQKTSYAFDVSAWELFWPFMQGCALLLPAPGAEKDPRRLAELIEQYAIRTIHFVPSMLFLFLDYIGVSGRKLPSLERVIVSGEALTPALNRRFYEIFAGTQTRLHNLYGPTECTVDVLYYDCAPQDAEIPIGRPVWNTGAWILDANGALLPPGESGELCITGVQLAHGYADPALDANRFVEHPRLGRIYKTGDQCSLRTDGQILYHGRGDGQVKIGGQRVELGEIERQLEQIPGVARAAVLLQGAHLQAFYIAQEPQAVATLTRFLRERLPAYMVPEQFLPLAEFPFSANGKLDRGRLAQLAAQSPPAANTPPAEDEPVTQTERQIMAAVRTQGVEAHMGDAPAHCGLSSLDIVEIAVELEAQGMLLQVGDFYTASDFHALATMAAEGGERPPLARLAGGRENAHEQQDPQSDEALPPSVACIGVPYGGGCFAVWADVARALPLPFYAVRSAHEDPDELLRTVLQLPFARFVLAGSCVGAGLAAALAQKLEAQGRLGGLCVVASAPPAGVWFFGRWFNPWLLRGPAATNRALQKLNRRKIVLGARERLQLRGDAAWFLRFLAEHRRLPLHAPVQLVYGAADPMMPRAHPERRWMRFFGRPVAAQVIPGAMHDVVHTHPQELAAILTALAIQ